MSDRARGVFAIGRDFPEAIFNVLVDPFHIFVARDVNSIQTSAEKAAHDLSLRAKASFGTRDWK